MGKKKEPDLEGRWECTDCHEWKFPWEYHPVNTNKNRLDIYCRECRNKRARYHSPAAKRKRFKEAELAAQIQLVANMLDAEESGPVQLGPPFVELSDDDVAGLTN